MDEIYDIIDEMDVYFRKLYNMEMEYNKLVTEDDVSLYPFERLCVPIPKRERPVFMNLGDAINFARGGRKTFYKYPSNGGIYYT